MKKILCFTMLFMCCLFAHSQNGDRIFNPWKVDLSLGYAAPEGAGAKGGGLFAVEAKYAVADQFWAGLRVEAAIMGRTFDYGNGSSDTKVSGSSSYLLTGDFYFTTENFRPFIGAGGGVYRLASVSVSDYGYGPAIAAATKMGAMIRAGFEAGHFRLAGEYNFVGNTSQAFDPNTGNIVNTPVKNGYLGIKVAFVFGGRRY